MRTPIPFRVVSLSRFVRFLQVFVCGLGTLGLAGESFAATLYGSTSAGGPGELYILNPATGAAVLDVGPLNDLLSVNYPVTGLAFNPINGFLYGSTGNSAAATQARLIRINPVTAQVTV